MPLKSVDDRIKIFNKINGYIDKYLDEDKSSSKCLSKRDNKLNFNGRIYLDSLIKVSSIAGSIYISYIEDDIDCKFITKIQLKDSNLEADNEIMFLKLIKNRLILENEKYKTFNIHMPLLYNTLECIDYNPEENIISIKDSSDLSSLNYYSSFVEKADGSLDDFIKFNKFREEDLFNIIVQCFIGLHSCHKLNIFHKDTHTGNFLYHKIDCNEDEYFEYKLFTRNKTQKTFYLKNIGYNFFVWDFGNSQKINKQNKPFIYNDFIVLIISIFDTLMAYNKSLNNSDVLYHLSIAINYYIKKTNIIEIMYSIFRTKYDYKFIRGSMPENAKIVKTISLYI